MHTAVYASGQVEAGQRTRKDQGDARVEKGLQARADTGVGCWTGGGDGQDVSGFGYHSGGHQEGSANAEFLQYSERLRP